MSFARPLSRVLRWGLVDGDECPFRRPRLSVVATTDFMPERYIYTVRTVLALEEQLARMIHDVAVFAGRPAQYYEDELKQAVEEAKEVLGYLGVKPLPTFFREVHRQLHLANYNLATAVAWLTQIRQFFEDGINGRVFLVLDKDDSRYWSKSQKNDLDIRAKFPGAAKDISEAAKCLAVGLNTAAVMHLARTAELAAVAMGTKLLVAPGDMKGGLGPIIEAIYDQLEVSNLSCGLNKTQRKPYREAANYLWNVKDVWRNDTYHSDIRYSRIKAVKFFDNTVAFLKTLAPLV